MRLALVSCVTTEIQHEISQVSFPSMTEYGDRLGIEFLPFYRDFGVVGVSHWQSRFDSIRSALEIYDRVIYLDPECFVRFDCPDLLTIVPSDHIGMMDDGDLRPIEKHQAKVSSLYNLSVIVASKEHSEFFDISGGLTDTSAVKIFHLPYRFNRTEAVARATGESLYDAFIANLGGPSFELKHYRKFSEKLSSFSKSGIPKTYQHLNIDAPLPLGDCVAMEPVVRYIATVMNPHAMITIRTAFPCVFDHLIETRLPSMTRVIADDEPFGIGRLVDLTRDLYGFSFNMMHPIDYGSLAAFGGILPKDERRIHLKSDHNFFGMKDNILIHPGSTWKSRTFPIWFWQAVIDGLIDAGFPVAVIGKNYPTGERGIVKGLDTSKCRDLVDKLSVSELIAVIRDSAMLISNDSSPVHISGAFLNPTILINSCKQKDFIWPHRDERLNITLGGHLRAAVPTIGLIKSTRLDECTDEELLSLLPSPEAVVREALRFFQGV